MKNKNIFLLSCLLFASTGNSLADTTIGIGIGVESSSGDDDRVFSIPVILDAQILIEPYIGYRNISEDSYTPSDHSSKEEEAYEYGAGLYGITKINTHFDFYYGAALALKKQDLYTEYASTNTAVGSSTFSQRESELTEWRFKPTLGISYSINDYFTLSLDAGLYVRWGEELQKTNSTDVYGSTTTIRNDESTYDLKGMHSFNRFIFRAIF